MSKKFRKALIVGVSSTLLLFVSVWAASYAVLPWQINKQLSSHQLALSEQSSIGFNPFTLELTIEKLTIVDSNNVVRAALEHGHINLSWLDLVRTQVVIESSLFDTFQLSVSRHEQGLTIGGVVLPNAQPQSTDDSSITNEDNAEAVTSDWRVLMPKLSVVNATFNIDDQGHQQLIVIDNVFELSHFDLSLWQYLMPLADAKVDSINGLVNVSMMHKT